MPLMVAQLGTSDLEPGSVARSSKTSPEAASFRALASETSGPGHDCPRASTVTVVTAETVVDTWDLRRVRMRDRNGRADR